MFKITRVDHTGFRTTDMEATVQFYSGILGLPLLQIMRGSEGTGEKAANARRYVFGAGEFNKLVFFDNHDTSPEEGSAQHLDHFDLHVETQEEFDEALQRLRDQGVVITQIIERPYGKTFYFYDPNGILLQIGLDIQHDPRFNEDPDPVPSALKYLVKG